MHGIIGLIIKEEYNMYSRMFIVIYNIVMRRQNNDRITGKNAGVVYVGFSIFAWCNVLFSLIKLLTGIDLIFTSSIMYLIGSISFILTY